VEETPEDIAERIHELEQEFLPTVIAGLLGIQNFISNSAYCTNLFKHNELRRTYIQTVLLKETW
jgi:folate-dependent phosphoribosylglycinamide formyltransferase PurN